MVSEQSSVPGSEGDAVTTGVVGHADHDHDHADHDHDHADHDHSNCDEALAELYTFIDGELTVERRSLIEQHLNDCNPCFEAFDFEAELRIVISHRCREAVPDQLRQRVAEQLAGIEQLNEPPGGLQPGGRG